MSRVNFPTTFTRDLSFSHRARCCLDDGEEEGGKKRSNELARLAFEERRRSLRSSASTLAKKFILARGERKREGARIERAWQDGGN